MTSDLARLVNMNNPAKVFAEVKKTARMISKNINLKIVDNAWRDIKKLFSGKYPDHKKCNTNYHDLKHTTDTMLATIRLIHASALSGQSFDDIHISGGIIAAIFHDTGYIQKSGDSAETGAKYTLNHVDRSIDFLKKYYQNNNFSHTEALLISTTISCTGLDVEINNIKFKSPTWKLIGKLLATADLIGQMADQTYLEKLLFLFYEFQEGKVPGYETEFNLLKKTPEFHELTKKRLEIELGNMSSFLHLHFKERWKIDKNFYEDAINHNLTYLKELIQKHPDDYRDFLRRGNLVEKLKKRYN